MYHLEVPQRWTVFYAILFLLLLLCAGSDTTGGYPRVESVLSDAAGVVGVFLWGKHVM